MKQKVILFLILWLSTLSNLEASSGSQAVQRNIATQRSAAALNKSVRSKKLIMLSARNNLRKLKYFRASKKDKLILSKYLGALRWKGLIQMSEGPGLTITTGKYASLKLGRKAIRTKCFHEIMRAAVQLHKTFKEFSFTLSSKVKNCKNISSGIAQMIINQREVKGNLRRFHSPMHSIYFADTTKFNHYLMGEIGLHVNVNITGEIAKRIVRGRTSRSEIRHETYEESESL